MKPAKQNEIDILLRSLGRRDPGVVSAQPAAHEHLDADELCAFAEGSVTERARARYSAHLSECTNCRGIVISLTQSTGFAAPRLATADKSAISFWQQLTAFVSLPALRFVIPAIVLVSIIGIGVIALRQDHPAEFVAQHDPSQQPANLDQAKQAASSQSPPTTEPAATPALPVALGTPPSPDARRGQSAGTIAGVGTSDGPAPLSKEAAQPSEAAPTFAPDVAAAAPPPAPAYAERDRGQTSSRQEAPKRGAEVGQEDEAPRPATDSVSRSKAATARAANQPGQSNVGLMSENRTFEDKDKNDASGRVDSKTVSGRRFIRRNNSWVDAAYQSLATTNVKRGSEQYRALIADEPGLRPFAEQLSGEVIVVWKGRAYRFH